MTPKHFCSFAKSGYIAAGSAFLVLLFFLLPNMASAQSQPFGATSPLQATDASSSVEASKLPRAFRGLELGMSMEEVKEALKSDSLFSYRGDPDVSLLPRPDESLIEVGGTSFIKRAFFQFYKDRLFIMIFAMNEKEIDHYSVFTTLSRKYGKPQLISPQESQWNDSISRVSIERPLTVKYMDMATFDMLKSAKEELRAIEDILRSSFLDEF